MTTGEEMTITSESKNTARTVNTARTWHRCPHCGGGMDVRVVIEPDTASPTHRATESAKVSE